MCARGRSQHESQCQWLAANGYLTPRAAESELPVFHVPTPEVIVSEIFALTHCFSALAHPDSAWFGLRFDPLPGNTVYDVRGIVWVDTVARRPVHVEYHYTRLAEFLREHEWRYAWEESGRRELALFREARRREAQPREPIQRRRTTKHPPSPNEEDFGGVIHFAFHPGRGWDVSRWKVVWPGMRGAASYQNSVAEPAQFRRIYYLDMYVHILTYTRQGEVLEFVPRRF